VYSSPAVANGVLYVGSLDSFVYAINASTGAAVWSYQTSRRDVGYRVWSSPVIADRRVFIGSNNFWLYALSAG
jgi:outer membrane protein assembly factor BamB